MSAGHATLVNQVLGVSAITAFALAWIVILWHLGKR